MIRILALGDSYTIGEGVRLEEGWPARLADQMRVHSWEAAEPVIIARSGWTTGDLLAALEDQKPVGPFDLVTLLSGVNNQYQGRGLEEYRAQFHDLLCRSIQLAGDRPGRVLGLSIPDWSVTPFAAGRDRAAIVREIDRFNEASREETVRAGARHVDITLLSRLAGSDPGWLAEDGLHPSARMHAAWVEQIWPAVLEMLKDA